MQILNVKSLVLAGALALASLSANAALVVSSDINPDPYEESYNFVYSSLPTSFSDYILLTFTTPINELEAGVSGTSTKTIDFDKFDLLSFDKATTLVAGDLSNPSKRAAGGFVADDLAAGSYWLFIKGTSTGVASYNGSISVISSVPEPETYAMMLIGLGLMGFVAKRRVS